LAAEGEAAAEHEVGLQVLLLGLAFARAAVKILHF